MDVISFISSTSVFVLGARNFITVPLGDILVII